MLQNVRRIAFLYEEDLGGGLFRGFSIENNEVTSVILYEESNPRVPHALREISASGTSRYFINIKDSYGKFWMQWTPLGVLFQRGAGGA